MIMYGYENWTVKKAEHQRTDAFELWKSFPYFCKENTQCLDKIPHKKSQFQLARELSGRLSEHPLSFGYTHVAHTKRMITGSVVCTLVLGTYQVRCANSS